jgi:hypothetical protein
MNKESNVEIINICKKCQETIQAKQKKNPLGFFKLKCEKCGFVEVKPLSKYYVGIYFIGIIIAIYVFTFTPAPLEKLGPIFLMFALCSFALIKNMFVKQSQNNANSV